MARKTKKGLDYFSHDCQYDNELKYIIALHKAEGYMVFFELLRKIYAENGYYLNADKKVLALFSNEINVSIENINAIINDCVNENIFNSDLFSKYNILTSKSIQERYFDAIKRRKEVDIIRAYILIKDVNIYLENVNINYLNADKSTQSRVEYSRVEYSRVFKKPTISEIKEYCQKRKNNIDPERFYNFYQSKGWVVGKAKMKDWMAAVRTWENKDKQDKKKKVDERQKNAFV